MPPAKRAGSKSVMGSLPSTRPSRLASTKRGATKPKAASSAKPKASSAKPKASSAKPKAPTRAKPRSKAAATKKAGATPATTAAKKSPALRAAPEVTEPAKPRRPAPVRAGARDLKAVTPPVDQERPPPRTVPPPPAQPTGAEVISTAIQAAGELAQIGVTVGGQLLKRALERLPRP